MNRQRVLLVRPWDTAQFGSGCCTGATSLGAEGRHESPIPTRQRINQRAFAEMYLVVRAGLPPEVDVEIVDPRNTLFLLPAMLRKGRRQRRRWPDLLRDLARASGYAAIIVDGRVVSDADLPAPQHALKLIRGALAESAEMPGHTGDIVTGPGDHNTASR